MYTPKSNPIRLIKPSDPPTQTVSSNHPLHGDDVLAGGNGAVVDRGLVGAREHAVAGEVLVEVRVDLGSTGGGAPVAHQVADDGEEGDDVDAGLEHLPVADVADLGRRGAAGLE